MIKIVRVPIQNLTCPRQDDFLELLIHSKDENHDYFKEIAKGSLSSAVKIAKQALAHSSIEIKPGLLRLMSKDFPLSSSRGASLALALSPHLLHSNCNYKHYIIIGSLVWSEDRFIVFPENKKTLMRKLDSIYRLGYQVHPTLLIMPKTGLDITMTQMLDKLYRNNVAVKVVADMMQAYAYCVDLRCQPQTS
jgi:hypothetical protein